MRRAYLACHPVCAMCGAPAEEVHHVLPIREGGSHDWDNLQALCSRCHGMITAKAGGMGSKS